MVAFISILVVILGFIFQSNKKYTWVMLLWMWVLFAFNTVNGDYIAYETIYNRIVANDARIISLYEEFFVLLCQMGGRVFGWNYQQFIIFIATLATILFAILIKLYCNGVRQNLVISLFMIFLYWMFICQHRTYIALLLVLIGLYFLNIFKDWRGIAVYLVFLLMAVGFHRMAALYIVLIASKFIDIKRLLLIVPILMFAVTQIRNPVFTSFMSKYLAGYKMDRWLYSDGSRTLTGMIILVFVRLLMVAVEYHCYYKRVRMGYKSKNMNNQKFILKVTIICLAMLPLELLKKDYERLVRLPLFLSFVFFAEYLEMSKIDRHHFPLNAIVYGSYLGLYLASFYVSFYGWFLHNLIPILNNNSLIPF